MCYSPQFFDAATVLFSVKPTPLELLSSNLPCRIQASPQADRLQPQLITFPKQRVLLNALLQLVHRPAVTHLACTPSLPKLPHPVSSLIARFLRASQGIGTWCRARFLLAPWNAKLFCMRNPPLRKEVAKLAAPPNIPPPALTLPPLQTKLLIEQVVEKARSLLGPKTGEAGRFLLETPC